MSRSLIQTQNKNIGAVEIGATIPLGSIIRRYGSIGLNGNNIIVADKGYYIVDAYATYTGTAGDLKIAILVNGIEVASSTETIATTESHSVAIPFTIRTLCCQDANISVVVSSTSTSTPNITEFGVRVVKE